MIDWHGNVPICHSDVDYDEETRFIANIRNTGQNLSDKIFMASPRSRSTMLQHLQSGNKSDHPEHSIPHGPESC